MSMKILFEFEKETKGTVRFKELSEDPAIGTLYVKKNKLAVMGISGKENISVVLEGGK